MKDAVFFVLSGRQRQDGHRLVVRIDNPVLGNSGFGVVDAFVYSIPASVSWSHDFDH